MPDHALLCLHILPQHSAPYTVGFLKDKRGVQIPCKW